MTLQEIKSYNMIEKRIISLYNLVKDIGKNPNKYAYKEWSRHIIASADNMQEMTKEDGYTISYQNIQILGADETKNGQPFRISVWEAALWAYNDDGKKMEARKFYHAFDCEQ